ncbi:NADH:flavin oxidoreductase / NADH oxidase family [Nakaseomyces glabratus]|nr:NADH:flavin oxidoreductase / NADH oxidase family [Nakaseomyces glabratus]KAH7584575.1 NADH:flavin oxidoreductase / NADH oxidase family [Nakaseomyces glabratus]KTA99790.1 putative NADPH dehydrogenase C23G7.10c [Nakaseomyces glabratus]KTB11531.1 putative NADPH dehydrogenase C23G7.10c [Nakaseomyces glabratus]
MGVSVKGAPNLDYFTPEQPILGKFIKYKEDEDGSSERDPPKLFKPLKIRALEIPNRIGVSPMCTYSTNNYMPTDFHLMHYGSLATRGPGIIIVECSAVSEGTAVTVNDMGIWNKEQASEHFSKIVKFAHSQNVIVGCQLGQFMRKVVQNVDEDNKAHNVEVGKEAHDLSTEEIKTIVEQWGTAAKLAVEVAKYDFIEIQAGKGHITNEFFSRLTNKRKDEYGGSFENRIRILLEIIDNVRKNIPKDTPLFIRLKACDNLDHPDAWSTDETIKLSFELAKHGVDVLDIAGRGLRIGPKSEKENKIIFLQQLKEAHKGKTNLLIASSGVISTADYASELLDKEAQDIILVGRPFLKNPNLVSFWADDVNITVTNAVQYSWGFYPTKSHLS